MQKTKIIITGGHITPAIAVIREIQKNYENAEIIFVGRRYVNDRENSDSFEYKEITKMNIPFIHLVTGRFTRILSWRSFVSLLKIPQGFFTAHKLIRKYKPDIVLSFGGYLAVPMCLVAKLHNVRIYTHEQTMYPGLANRIISRVANKIFVSFPETKRFFTSKKVVVSGNPLRNDIFKVENKPFEVQKTLPVVYITGGSLGSHSINVHTEAILYKLIEQFTVVHQTGNVKEYNDYERLLEKQNMLPQEYKDRYHVVSHFAADEIGYIYSVSDLVIGRSGANTFFEVIALQKPAIFVPLPWSAHHEQQKQADIFEKAGAGKIFDQSKKSEELFSMIEEITGNLPYYKNNIIQLQNLYTHNAAQIITQEIFGN